MILPPLLARPPLWPGEGSTRPLAGLVLAMLSLVVGLAWLAHAGTSQALGDWNAEVGREATALIRPRADESGATAAARAAEALAAVDGVEEAVALTRAEAENLLRPWLGEAELETLPLPQLVRIRLQRDTPAGVLGLNRALAEAGVDGTVDDHSLWREDFHRAAHLVRALTAAGVIVFALLAAATGWLLARQAVEGRLETLGALRLAGARPDDLVRLAQWNLARQGLVAALAGTGAAWLCGMALALFPPGETLGRLLPLTLIDLAPLLAWPPILVAAMALSARFAIRAWLGRNGGRV